MVEKPQKPPEKKADKKPEKKPIKKEKVFFATGKRKKSVARASMKKGNGKVTINSISLESIENSFVKSRINEPLQLAGSDWKGYDINVKVTGGGIKGQAEASRQAISRALVQIFGNQLKKTFLNYDKYLLVYDPRRTEPHKPPRSSQGPRRYKQRSKR